MRMSNTIIQFSKINENAPVNEYVYAYLNDPSLELVHP